MFAYVLSTTRVVFGPAGIIFLLTIRFFLSYIHIETFSINPFWSSQIRVRVCVYTLRLCLGVGTFRSDRERAAILFATAKKIQFPEIETEIKI